MLGIDRVDYFGRKALKSTKSGPGSDLGRKRTLVIAWEIFALASCYAAPTGRFRPGADVPALEAIGSSIR